MDAYTLKELKRKYNNGEVWRESTRVSKVDKEKGVVTLVSNPGTYEISEETMLIWQLLNIVEELQKKLEAR